jgi:hypothetical protein
MKTEMTKHGGEQGVFEFDAKPEPAEYGSKGINHEVRVAICASSLIMGEDVLLPSDQFDDVIASVLAQWTNWETDNRNPRYEEILASDGVYRPTALAAWYEGMVGFLYGWKAAA